MARITWDELRKPHLRNNPEMLLGPLITGTNPDGTPFALDVAGLEKSQLQRAAEQAKVYFAGSGRLSLSVAGNIRGTLTNPAGATTNVHVLRMSGLGTSVSWANLLLNPTAGLPASAARRVNNNILSMAGDASVLKVDTDTTTALSGGTDLGTTLGVPGGRRFQIDFNIPIVLGPGASLGVAIPFTGAADAAFSLYWYRTPA